MTFLCVYNILFDHFYPIYCLFYNPHSVSAFIYLQAPFTLMSSIPQQERKHLQIGLVRLYL